MTVGIRGEELPSITQFYKRLSCLENFKDVGEYSSDKGAKMSIRRISAGDQENLGRWTILRDQINKIMVFGHHNGAHRASFLEN